MMVFYIPVMTHTLACLGVQLVCTRWHGNQHQYDSQQHILASLHINCSQKMLMQ